MSVVSRIARFGVRDLSRSRWLTAYACFFGVATWALFRFNDTEQKALLALVNVALFVVPLASVVFGSVYLYSSREFVELMLAQPVARQQLYAGMYLGLVLSMAGAGALGLGIPLILVAHAGASLAPAVTLIAMTAALSAAFTGIAAVIAYAIEDRVRGLAAALGAWLVLAVAYDALVLMLATQFADYPIERGLLGAMIANPIDLARLLLLFQFDVAALLGYTGAVFQRFFGAALGTAIAATALVAWAVIPAAAGRRLFSRKDF
jgi:Cu-processing system permease protein